jgi:hypothetical protein
MGESKFLNDWANRAVLQARRKDLLRILQLRSRQLLPADLVEAVNGCDDQHELDRWFELTVTTNSLAEFRAGAGV